MKKWYVALLAVCIFVAAAALAEADEVALIKLYMEHGLLRDEAGNDYGMGNPSAYDAWEREEWSKGNATPAVAWAPQCVVNGLVYTYYNGDLFGYLDEAALKEDRYWTTKEDPYYHADAGCDGGEKYPISASAAESFDKRACPVCMLAREPISFEVQEKETPFTARFDCPEGTDLTGYSDCYAGSVRTEEGALIHMIADSASGNLYAFRDRCDGAYQIIFTKYSLKELNAARETARAALEENNISATCEIDIPENTVKVTLTNPADAERVSSLDFPLCIRICTE